MNALKSFPSRRHRRNASFGYAAVRLAFIETYGRCPECAAMDAEFLAHSSLPFDLARDRALLRRDVNEALEAITLEALPSPSEWSVIEGGVK